MSFGILQALNYWKLNVRFGTISDITAGSRQMAAFGQQADAVTG